MKIYIANVDNRKGESEIIGVYKEKSLAVDNIKKYVYKRYSNYGILNYLADYGGDLEEGEFNAEDQIIYIVERELE